MGTCLAEVHLRIRGYGSSVKRHPPCARPHIYPLSYSCPAYRCVQRTIFHIKYLRYMLGIVCSVRGVIQAGEDFHHQIRHDRCISIQRQPPIPMNSFPAFLPFSSGHSHSSISGKKILFLFLSFLSIIPFYHLFSSISETITASGWNLAIRFLYNKEYCVFI